MRAIGIDVHRDFCEVAISEGGELRSAGRVPSTPHDLELLAASLAGDDEIALEATGNALAIARILEPHVARVVVASAKELHAITGAKAKTDRRDARTLAKLLSAGLLEGTWLPGEELRALRRRLSHRAQLVRARSRLKSEVHAALLRNLVGAPSADRSLRSGRTPLARPPRAARRRARDARQLPARHGLLRRRDRRLRAGHRPLRLELARDPPAGDDPRCRPAVRRHLLAVVGDVHRFPSARRLVGYLGLDPRVRQSGSTAARTGSHLQGGPLVGARGALRGRPRGAA